MTFWKTLEHCAYKMSVSQFTFKTHPMANKIANNTWNNILRSEWNSSPSLSIMVRFITAAIIRDLAAFDEMQTGHRADMSPDAVRNGFRACQ